MGFRVKGLSPEDPPDSFPDPALAGIALGQPAGLVAIGGDLSNERLLAAYRKGIFPWFNDDQPILWWSPDPRAVIFPESFHMSRSLTRELRHGGWQYSLNHEFDQVISCCASGRGEHGTWITPDMLVAYKHAHSLGFAHSVESWRNGELAGGIYGIRLGSVFFGESMFSVQTSGSKVAISALAHICLETGIKVIDCQVGSSHLKSLGMQEIPRGQFLDLLRKYITHTNALPDWKLGRREAEPLAALGRRR